MPLFVINDLHIGAIRSGGTTPATAIALRADLLARLKYLLDGIDCDLLINGDLLDQAFIPMSDLWDCYELLFEWLTKGHHLYLPAGNHDLSKSSQVFSSFQLLVSLLYRAFPDKVVPIYTTTLLPEHDACVIPHMPNQDLFNIELTNVPKCDYLFLHCNYDNKFAVEADHSLNLSEEQAKALPAKFIVLGHEHQARSCLKGKVVVVGNQFPSSVSDCIGESHKNLLYIESGAYTLLTTWKVEGEYSEQDWRSLTDTGKFIRVVGSAEAEEANAVVSAISKFRSTAKALVITNAVQIAGMVDGAQISMSLEQIRGFSVFDALLECLTPEEGAKLTKLREGYSV